MDKRLAGALFAASVLIACTRQSPAAPTSPIATGPPIRVLLLTATLGYRHDSIETARDVLASLARSTGAFTVRATEDVSSISSAGLADVDVIAFILTSGELPLAASQRAAMLDFVRGGKGFIGVHSATDTLYEWPDYGTLVGAYFKEHPWTQVARVVVEAPSHPAAGTAGDAFSIEEEFYTFRENPRPHVQVLLRLDAASVGTPGDFPLAWTQTFGSGRVYYNALGHFQATWRDSRFQSQIVGAIRWAGSR